MTLAQPEITIIHHDDFNGQFKDHNKGKKKGNKNVCGRYSVVIFCLFFVFLESNSPPLVDAGQSTDLPGNRKTASVSQRR